MVMVMVMVAHCGFVVRDQRCLQETDDQVLLNAIPLLRISIMNGIIL